MQFKLSKHIFGLLILLGCALSLSAQKVSFQLLKSEAVQNFEQVFLAGNFNGWNPADDKFRFDKNGTFSFTFKSGDIIAFKCTQGSWGKVEVQTNGQGIDNRTLKVTGDTTIQISISSWSHLFIAGEKKHTASPNVIVFDTAFLFPQLGYSKKVSIYLPPDYQHSNKKYPVLYMTDGQNLFDEYFAPYGEWKVDEAMDSMYAASGKSVIVVAVDHSGEKRVNEYNPYVKTKYGEGRGQYYLTDLVNTLKPAIDSAFRTSASRSSTWLAGSSMGGVVSTYGVFDYTDVFAGAGVFSPAYWINSNVSTATITFSKQKQNRHYFYCYAGGLESEEMVKDISAVYQILQSDKSNKSKLVIDPVGKHNEATWAHHFHGFLQFMVANCEALRGE